MNPYIERTIAEFWTLLHAPLNEPELWWIVTPLIIALMIMTFYFGKYIREQLGWNTALSNSIVLIFIGIDQLRTIYHYSFPPTIWQFAWHPITTLVIVLIMIEGIMLSITAFKHALPPKVMFLVTSPVSVYVQAYVLTAIVYTQATPTFYTFFAAILLWLVLFATIKIIQETEHLIFGYHFNAKKKK